MGVWIEINDFRKFCDCSVVTPFVGVWIEILMLDTDTTQCVSLPSWECGLKLI